MLLKNLCTAFLLGFLPTIIQAYVTPGTYFIVNRARAPHGPVLALNFSGENSPAVVSEKTFYLTQLWVITDFDGAGQAIRSAFDPSLEVGRVGNTLTIVPFGLQVWEISENADGYCRFQNPDGTAIWGLTSTDSGSSVVVETLLGQRGEWVIEAV